jgi:hypothetical protein
MGDDSGVQQPWPWPDELDAMIAAPAFHRRLFENDHVRAGCRMGRAVAAPFD